MSSLRSAFVVASDTPSRCQLHRQLQASAADAASYRRSQALAEARWVHFHMHLISCISGAFRALRPAYDWQLICVCEMQTSRMTESTYF
jgi:hypothetical protein